MLRPRLIYSEEGNNNVGQDVFSKTIDEAVKNRRVKAIVLRIDSPGGVHSHLK